MHDDVIPPAELHKLLTGYFFTKGRREPMTREELQVWHRAAVRGRWRPGETERAIERHMDTSTAWLEPSHINELLRQDRRQPAPFDALALEVAPPATEDSEAKRRAMAEIAATLGRAKAIPAADEADDGERLSAMEDLRRLTENLPMPRLQLNVGESWDHEVVDEMEDA